MKMRMAAWKKFAALQDETRAELGKAPFNANDRLYGLMIATFYAGYTAGTADSAELVEQVATDRAYWARLSAERGVELHSTT